MPSSLFRRHTRLSSAVVAMLAFVLLHAPLIAQSAPAPALDTTYFDRSVRPQDDFFRFVNGGWLAKVTIPDDAVRWGAADELGEHSREAMHEILEEAAATLAPAGSERRKVGDLYASFMDSALVDSRGLAPIRHELLGAASVWAPAHLPPVFAHLTRIGVGIPLSVSVGADAKHSMENIVHIGQAGLSLPDRSYYLQSDERMRAVRQSFQSYVSRLLTLAHQPDPNGSATRVLALETALARAQWDRARTRDRNATYNRMTVAQLAATSPHFDWKLYLSHAGLSAATEVIVAEPDYVVAVDSLIAAAPITAWREYLTFRILDAYANELPSAFATARFDFRGKVLSGQQVERARWKRGVAEVEATLGEAAGKLYVEREFKPAAKARMDQLVRNLREAYRVGIDSLEWMTPATKAKAQEKLANFTVKIAYPDKWRDYGPLAIRRGDLLGNVMRARIYNFQDQVNRLGKPVDRTRWSMTPQTVNAYYLSTSNEIVFPAAILQPPFFDPEADDAVNYGAIGAVIGHEIGHGFDDQGRRSDGAGNLTDWWTPADAAAFDARAAKLGAQYDALSPVEGAKVNGKLTMGENIGDLSGLAQAYRAYHISLGGKEPPVIAGFTGDQRFFIGFARIWRSSMREAALRQQLVSDSHSPAMYRVLVPLQNNDAFQRAFDVKPGDKMYRAPEDRVRIW